MLKNKLSKKCLKNNTMSLEYILKFSKIKLTKISIVIQNGNMLYLNTNYLYLIQIKKLVIFNTN